MILSRNEKYKNILLICVYRPFLSSTTEPIDSSFLQSCQSENVNKFTQDSPVSRCNYVSQHMKNSVLVLRNVNYLFLLE